MKGGVCRRGYSLSPIGSSPGPYGGVSTGCEPRFRSLSVEKATRKDDILERKACGRAAAADFGKPTARKNERMRALVLVASVVAALVSGGCSSAEDAPPTVGAPKSIAPQLVPASAELREKCRATANEVGYPVPCPTRVLDGLTATQSISGCGLDIIGPGGIGGCAKSWRGWVVGSSETNDQHLVIVASPHALPNYAKVVNGPAWYPGARVRLLQRMKINGWRMQAVYVPFGTNAGSAFARHVVLIWTVDDHTYGVGFHNVHSLRQTLALDLALARGIRLMTPETGS
jgi:hypothetical protein